MNENDDQHPEHEHDRGHDAAARSTGEETRASGGVPRVAGWISDGPFPGTPAAPDDHARDYERDHDEPEGRAVTPSGQRGRGIALRMLATLEERYQAQIAAQQSLIDELRRRAEHAERALADERGRAATAPKQEEVAALRQVQDRNLSDLAALRRQLGGLQERIGEQDRTLATQVQPARPGFFGRLFGGTRD